MKTPLNQQILDRFDPAKHDLDRLIAPLVDLTYDSSSLVLGYGMSQAGVRDKMIPYFHVCGTFSDLEPVRALIIGGWAGHEHASPLAVSLLIAALESRLSLAEGLEVTAYPVGNPEAYHAMESATASQKSQGMTCWTKSAAIPVRVMENELRRYPYEAVIVLRENPRAKKHRIDLWPGNAGTEAFFTKTLASKALHIRPESPSHPRSFTPVTETTFQPTEIHFTLPASADPKVTADEALSLILPLLEALSQARLQGEI